MTVSAALIVKDEARVLARCLSSLRPHVDEIVVVDTGSADETPAIAKQFTERVRHFAWCDDFAAARQYAFDQATGDWVMWVDADDVVLGGEHIRSLTAGAPPGLAGFSWRYIYSRDNWGNSQCELWRERCVRHDGSFQWIGRVHEVLVGPPQKQLAHSDAVIVEHRPDPRQRVRKTGRNLAILEAEAADTATPAPRLLFYLAREYADAGRYQQALAAYEQYLAVCQWDEERYLAQTAVAALHRALSQYDRAVDADLQALKTAPQRPEAYFGLAQSYYFLEAWSHVVHWAEIGNALPLPPDGHINNPRANAFDWIIYYVNALYRLGRTEEALSWTQRALTICPDDAWHQANYLFFTDEKSVSANGPSRLEDQE
jgi:tetratricopeptide (TPR) repeat protein